MDVNRNSEFSIGQWWYLRNGDEIPIFYQVCNETTATVSFITVACKAQRIGNSQYFALTPTMDFDSTKSTPYQVSGNVTIYPPIKTHGFMKRKPKRYKGYLEHSDHGIKPLMSTDKLEYTQI